LQIRRASRPRLRQSASWLFSSCAFVFSRKPRDVMRHQRMLARCRYPFLAGGATPSDGKSGTGTSTQGVERASPDFPRYGRHIGEGERSAWDAPEKVTALTTFWESPTGSYRQGGTFSTTEAVRMARKGKGPFRALRWHSPSTSGKPD
jgi:hypothetical protein